MKTTAQPPAALPPVSGFPGLPAVMTGLLAMMISLAWVPAPVSAQLPLVPGDHVRIVSDTLQGEFTFLGQEGSILRLLRADGEPQGETVMPMWALTEISVARFEAAHAARRRGALGGAGAGAAAGFVVGFIAGMGTEYGAEGGLAFGVGLALPGALIGALVGRGSVRPRMEWESVPLDTRSTTRGRTTRHQGRIRYCLRVGWSRSLASPSG